ncbi:RNA polymerase sigma-30 (SigH) subunit [Natranaerovirga pectinivora]|uniref:RNA polymerase sigma factor SigS n=1 Tax=Natranaerovirga pectinivora TaxID=682400 RepID=A0A4R3MN54_9FIRM|nr:RNA polymerase sporulation sigma factor SigH [Natranaerovirga pectinivora]TCT15723.1 RNA polymerase sigma-30 (SigH) subunit [Natranaerovirga pectinivora]
MDNTLRDDTYLKDYKHYTDEEIILHIKSGDNDALEYLMNKYKNLVKKKARTYFLIGADSDDIIQEGMIGLYKAIRDFKDDKEASFKVFAELCVTRQIISAIKASTRKKHVPLNSYISLNKPMYEEDYEKNSLLDRMPSEKVVNPEEMLIDKENLNMIEYELDNRLSGFEKDVLKLYLDGVNYTKIAELLDRPIKSIDNALQRIKRKVELILEENNNN